MLPCDECIAPIILKLELKTLAVELCCLKGYSKLDPILPFMILSSFLKGGEVASCSIMDFSSLIGVMPRSFLLKFSTNCWTVFFFDCLEVGLSACELRSEVAGVLRWPDMVDMLSMKELDSASVFSLLLKSALRLNY